MNDASGSGGAQDRWTASAQPSPPSLPSALAPPTGAVGRFATPPLDAPPRVTRAFAFVDLCGFTDFVDTYGDFEALVELTTLRRILREATLLHRARVDKWLGDGALLVALDTETMLEAVLAAGREHHGRGRLLLRGGVTEGPAILCDDDYVGAVVNLASRLCDSAAPGTILVQTSEDPRDPGSPDCRERDTARRIIGRATALSLLPEMAGDGAPTDPAPGAR